MKYGRKTEDTEDEFGKLMCAHHGCNRRWTVNTGKPMCSDHQWGNKISLFPSLPQPDPMEARHNDGKDWARRIVKLAGKGYQVRPLSLKMAREALRMNLEAA